MPFFAYYLFPCMGLMVHAHCLPLHALLPEGVLHATPPLQGVPRRLGRVQLQFARLSGRGIGRAPLQGGEGPTENTQD